MHAYLQSVWEFRRATSINMREVLSILSLSYAALFIREFFLEQVFFADFLYYRFVKMEGGG